MKGQGQKEGRRVRVDHSGPGLGVPLHVSRAAEGWEGIGGVPEAHWVTAVPTLQSKAPWLGAGWKHPGPPSLDSRNAVTPHQQHN